MKYVKVQLPLHTLRYYLRVQALILLRALMTFFSLTPHLLDQSDLNDLVRDLVSTKKKSELLASRLKQWNLLRKGVKGIFIVLVMLNLKSILQLKMVFVIARIFPDFLNNLVSSIILLNGHCVLIRVNLA